MTYISEKLKILWRCFRKRKRNKK